MHVSVMGDITTFLIERHTSLAVVMLFGFALLYVTPTVLAAIDSESPQDVVAAALSFVLHLDMHLNDIILRFGNWTYAAVFAVIFAETGLVVTPFLPGDSLLFACGILSAMGPLQLELVMGVCFVAAVLGDSVNYALGRWLGRKVFTEDSKIFKKEYITKTEAFYEKYGAKTVALARLVPIVRTFAPFVAGVGSMNYRRFMTYNIAGAAAWVTLLTGGGSYFADIPAVQHNFGLVVLGIVILSILPAIFEVVAARRADAAGGHSQPPAPEQNMLLCEQGTEDIALAQLLQSASVDDKRLERMMIGI